MLVDRATMLTALALTAVYAEAAQAAAGQPEAFADGDPALGKPIVERDCVSCHAGRFNGDAERIYLRPDRRVHTPAQLIAQVRYCNTQLGGRYFPDEEAHIAAHLNATYYHFRP